ncbi:MAG: hypothetical protein ACRDQX_12890, partial [Pseudonocardiaceae bacterium]
MPNFTSDQPTARARLVGALKLAPIQTVGLAVILAVFAAGMLLQQERFHLTPSYGNLIRISPVWVWGVLHLL